MWFAANLLFESCHTGQTPEANLWEERIVLLDARSEDEARHEAEKLGKQDEPEFTSATGEEVRWRFRGVEQVQPLDVAALESGTEVFYRFLRASEVASLRTPFHEASVPERTERC